MLAERASRTLGHLVVTRIVLLIAFAGRARTDTPSPVEGPTFSVPISNVTVPVGREAVLACVVEDLSTYKVAWLRVTTQTILTIASHVITKNHRIGVTHTDHRTWQLHVRDVHESDRGEYMCQINTDPMKSQIGYLEVVVPPDILDYPTSTDMVVREGSNVTLRCAAIGFPTPSIIWRREGGESIIRNVTSVEGPDLNITRVNRLQMGAYFCIASNGVPPTVSKRIMLIVHFPPMISVQNQLVGAREGEELTLECNSEAYPKSINYWMRDKHGTLADKHEIIATGGKYEPVFLDNAYKVHMKLTIRSMGPNDYGIYKCVSKNSLGSTDGSIKLYHIPTPTTQLKVTTTTPLPVTVIPAEKKQRSQQKTLPSSQPSANEIIDASKSGVNEGEDMRLRDRQKDDDGGGGGGGDGDTFVDGHHHRHDNTAQSMSSNGAPCRDVSWRKSAATTLCVVLLAILT